MAEAGRGRGGADDQDDAEEGSGWAGRDAHGRDASGRYPIGGDPNQGYYAMGSAPGAPDEPPMGKGGTSYYYDGEDPRPGTGR